MTVVSLSVLKSAWEKIGADQASVVASIMDFGRKAAIGRSQVAHGTWKKTCKALRFT